MTQEEKAKAYDKAIEIARKLYERGTITESLGHIFPELKESEDERIRKWLIAQLEIKSGSNDIDRENMILKAITWLEKQGEKHTDKVKLNFKIGDWITDGYIGGQITSIEDNYPCYKIADFMGGDTSVPFSLQDNYHLWTIQDAKDGDVLISKDKEDILIYKSYSLIDLLLTSYISFNKKEGFCPRQYSAWDSNEFIPATKEQRDQLEKAMADAGYTFDFEKKELKKIKQKPVWSEEDEKELNSCIEAIEACYKWDTMVDWLKSLKQRIGG